MVGLQRVTPSNEPRCPACLDPLLGILYDGMGVTGKYENVRCVLAYDYNELVLTESKQTSFAIRNFRIPSYNIHYTNVIIFLLSRRDQKHLK